MHKGWIFVVAVAFLGLGCVIGILIEQNSSEQKYQELKGIESELIVTQIKSIASYPEQTWLTIKSPNSNMCYEVVLFENWDQNGRGYGYMGMSKIACEVTKVKIPPQK